MSSIRIALGDVNKPVWSDDLCGFETIGEVVINDMLRVVCRIWCLSGRAVVNLEPLGIPTDVRDDTWRCVPHRLASRIRTWALCDERAHELFRQAFAERDRSLSKWLGW